MVRPCRSNTPERKAILDWISSTCNYPTAWRAAARRSEEHTSELQSPCNLVCRLLLEKKTKKHIVGPRQVIRHTTLSWLSPNPFPLCAQFVKRLCTARCERPKFGNCLSFFFFKSAPPPAFFSFPLPVLFLF